MQTTIRRVAVLGAGTMGHGIAEVFAIAGFEVYVRDISEEILRNALSRIRDSLERLAKRGSLREDVNTVMARIKTTLDIREAVEGADFIIEAIPEDARLKKELFSEVDKYAPPHAIIASNTSTIPITELSKSTSRPDRFIGMHFMNPPPLMPLVEVIRGDYTSEETLRITLNLVKVLGKEPVVVNKDVPGFIVNRVLFRIMVEACREVTQEGVKIIDLDAMARNKLGLPMGPFELLDYIGLDTSLFIIKAMSERGYKTHTCTLLEDLVGKRKLGVKSGEGFYKYPAPGQYAKPRVLPDQGIELDPVRLMAPAINEMAWLIREGVATVDDVDKSVKLGLNFPFGLSEFADEAGIDNVVDALTRLRETTGWEEYDPDPLLQGMVKEGRLGRKSGRGFREYPGVSERPFKELILRLDPPIAWIVLNKPDKLNVLTPSMADEVVQALRAVEDDPNIRVVVITGSGRAFCAGADINQFLNATPIQMFKAMRHYQAMTLEIEYYTKPVIAAINGYALGGGLEIAMACDIRVASEDAVLGQPEINLGIIPGAGGTQRLPRLTNMGIGKELILRGNQISAATALRYGLVNRVVPKYALEYEVRKLAEELASKPPLTLALAKYAVSYGYEAPIWSGLSGEASLFATAISTKDAQEGVRAFLEKRRPRFTGE
ncbi:3-hydroxyacyl-CoA dehydrogenase/enoyl-CoA hydratase family protein [Vulcanisaeta thermophila]|uniref:3-hydroxyacyl-CoA dehydrogenase/enoyl-CoA hydratase family protein n=1 Tax=Vulcanisaeta thermophila TaxID=867917 RepID=UPI000B07ABE4|nr:3-hydroxyacyl-CoA dehydrogenase/enoyl-CoA hydratase family protein [Vulcanisaeta thermophila]